MPYAAVWHALQQKCKICTAASSQWAAEGQETNSGCSAFHKALQPYEITENTVHDAGLLLAATACWLPPDAKTRTQTHQHVKAKASSSASTYIQL